MAEDGAADIDGGEGFRFQSVWTVQIGHDSVGSDGSRRERWERVPWAAEADECGADKLICEKRVSLLSVGSEDSAHTGIGLWGGCSSSGRTLLHRQWGL